MFENVKFNMKLQNVVQSLIANPKGKFVCQRLLEDGWGVEESTLEFKDGELIWGNVRLHFSTTTIDDYFAPLEEVEKFMVKYVSFEEAVQAWLDGKTFIMETIEGYKYRQFPCWRLGSLKPVGSEPTNRDSDFRYSFDSKDIKLGKFIIEE